MDLRSNLKSVKKEDIKQEKVQLLKQTNCNKNKKTIKPHFLNVCFANSGADLGGGRLA